ncbi:MAG: cytochrome c [Myxococcota bacterium]
MRYVGTVLTWVSLPVSSLAIAVGCASSPPPAAEPAPPATFAEQVTLGQAAYGRSCAGCHGAAGEGATAPRVVGLAAGALPLDPPADRQARKSRFVTVADVATFVVQTMPPKAPGSLSAEEYWAVLAFDLHANGIDLQQKLTPELAATLTIPRAP